MNLKKCNNFRLWVSKWDGNQAKIMRIRCGQWNCEYCAELNAHIWRSKLRYALRMTPGTWQFITYTAHKNWRGTLLSYKNISRNSDKLWQRYRRLAKKSTDEKFVYARLLEAHKDGSVHVHAFVRAPMGMYAQTAGRMRENRTRLDMNGIGWLKQASAECGMGWSVDCTEITDVSKAVGYVTKYVSKGLFGLELPKKARRVQTSQKFPVPEHLSREKTGDWEVMKYGVPTSLLIMYIARGQEVYDVDLKKVISYDDLLESGEYYDETNETGL